jgi:hypothetical protein
MNIQTEIMKAIHNAQIGKMGVLIEDFYLKLKETSTKNK